MDIWEELSAPCVEGSPRTIRRTNYDHMNTRNLRNLIGVAATAVLLAACVPSVHPFYTEKDVVYDARLLGGWQSKGKEEDQQTWKFERSGEKAYKLLVTEKGNKHGEFDAHLFKLKDQLFLDLMPAKCEFAEGQADLVAASIFPGHLLMRVARVEPALQLALMDYDWLAKYLKDNPGSLAHQEEQERLLLTASTRELQGFVQQHLGPGELFQAPVEWERSSEP